MPIFTPGRRWQGAYRAFHKESFTKSALARLELLIKSPLFGCRMCGNCLLQETAFICPMECPKGLRNGPCGGSTAEGCYVDMTRPCIWYEINKRAEKMGREEMLLEVLPPVDWDQVGTEAWSGVVDQWKSYGGMNLIKGMMSKDEETKERVWDEFFVPIRQADWWQGDKEYHPPAYDEPVSNLERKLKTEEFTVTVEVTPPLGAVTGQLRRHIETVKPYAAAINFTEGASAAPRMPSQACAVVSLELGAEPIMQIAARDTSRIGLQGTAIAAGALGIPNLFVVTGDNPSVGPIPRGRMDIVDLDSVQMIWILRRLRDEGIFLDKRTTKFAPQYFIGAVASPLASEPKFQAIREHKKVNAGAQFFQTNLIFDADGLEPWLNELAKRDILDKVHILIGISILKNMKMAMYMHEQVPGIRIPQHILDRLEKAGDNAAEEGFQISLELIQNLRKIKELSGVHIMPVGREEDVPRLMVEAGLASPDSIQPATEA